MTFGAELLDDSSDISKSGSKLQSVSVISQPANKELPPLEELRKKETEEIFNYILPPKQWEENGKVLYNYFALENFSKLNKFIGAKQRSYTI